MAALTPREVLERWIEATNARDAAAMTALYHEDATNLQIPEGIPIKGHRAIKAGLDYFAAFARNHTRALNIFVDGEWATLEFEGTGQWTGEFDNHHGDGSSFKLQGCGIFQIVDGRIKTQRGYWDRYQWYVQLGIKAE